MAASPWRWWSIGIDAWLLWADAATVVALRSSKLAEGGAAGVAEAQLMVAEKIGAAIELQSAWATGKLGRSAQSASRGVIAHYRPKVRRNRRRLTRKN